MTKESLELMTPTRAEEIISSSTRCTQATLRAFGIEGYPFYRSGCLEYYTRNGFKLTEIKLGLNVFRMRDIPKWNKDWLNPWHMYSIHTKHHAMALINGILIDTERKGFDSRKIENIWIVERKDSL